MVRVIIFAEILFISHLRKEASNGKSVPTIILGPVKGYADPTAHSFQPFSSQVLMEISDDRANKERRYCTSWLHAWLNSAVVFAGIGSSGVVGTEKVREANAKAQNA